MKKTTLYLDPEVDRAVARLARAQGRSKAEIMREAIAEKARDADRPRFTAIGVITGDGPGDVSQNVDRYLAETGYGED